MLKKIAAWTKNNYLLLIVMVFYLCVVFYCFDSQGLINWDEAYFVVISETYSTLFKTVITHPADLFSAQYYHELIANYGNIYTAARPSYIIPAAIIGLIVPAEYSTRLVSVLSGLLALVFFYRLTGFFNMGKKIRFAAAFLLAASPLFLAYSRLGLSQMFSAAWIIIALYYLLDYNRNNGKHSLRKAGLALSILLMSHYNTLIVVVGLSVVGAFFIFQKKKPFKEYLLFFIFFLLLPVIYEAITRTGVAIAAAKGLLGTGGNFPIFSYSQEVLEQFNRNGAQTVSEPGLMLYYLKLMISPEGLIFFVLFLAGLAIFVKRIKKDNYLVILVPLLLHLVYFSISGIKFTRNLVTVLPALYIFAALGLGAIVRFLKPRLGKAVALAGYLLPAIFCVAVMFLNVWQYNTLLNIKTNFREVASFVRENFRQDQSLILSSSAPFWRVYLPGFRSEMTREISEWTKKYPDRKIIFISDYFNTIVNEEEYLEGYYRKLLKEWSTNIFSARPIVLDFIYQGEEENVKMFAANEPSSPVVVYELSIKRLP